MHIVIVMVTQDNKLSMTAEFAPRDVTLFTYFRNPWNDVTQHLNGFHSSINSSKYIFQQKITFNEII